MYEMRLKNFAPACLLAALLSAAPACAAAPGAGWAGSQSFSLPHPGASPFAPFTHTAERSLLPTPRASASSALTAVNEWGRLHKVTSKGTTIDEEGVGWGTFNCSVIMRMTLNGTLVTASYTAYLSGGTISGTATAHIYSYDQITEVAEFGGTISLHGGTGSRAHASGTASFSGKINHKSYGLNTHINGNLRL
jgi:hypothetical protein